MLCLSFTRVDPKKINCWQPILSFLILGAAWVNLSSNIQAQSLPSKEPSGANSSLSAEDNFHQGNLTQAIQQWSRDIKNGIKVTDALFNRSQTYILLKQYDFAIQDLNQFIQIQGKNTPAEVYIIRGIALNELDQIPAAIESFNQAEKIQASPLVYTNRALAYQRAGQLNQALQDLKKSVQMAPTSITRLNLANLRLQLGQFDQVVKEMNQLITTEKSFFSCVFNSWYCLL